MYEYVLITLKMIIQSAVASSIAFPLEVALWPHLRSLSTLANNVKVRVFNHGTEEVYEYRLPSK